MGLRKFTEILAAASLVMGTIRPVSADETPPPPTVAWSTIGAPPRQSIAAAYDSRRHRMVVFGGYDRASLHNDVWTAPLSGVTEWQQLIVAGTPPTPRMAATAVYDSAGDRMVVFGGWDGPSYRQDVWALSLGGPPAWQLLTPAGTPPAGREDASSAVDAARGRMLVFGGYAPSQTFNDVWALSLGASPVWSQVITQGIGPAPRGGAGVIVDPVQDRLIVAGGAPPQGSVNDGTWSLSLSGTPAWSPLAAPGPLPSSVIGNSAIYDPQHRRMVILDFYSYGIALNLDDPVPAWTPLAHQSYGNRPQQRYAHAMIYDPEQPRVIVHGGYQNTQFDDTWSYEASSDSGWRQLAPSGQEVPKRGSHVAIVDALRQRMIVYGGQDPSERHDVWSYDLRGGSGWTKLQPTGTPPPVYQGSSAVCDSLRDRMIVFGGQGVGLSNGVWSLSLGDSPAWTAITTFGPSPSPRRDHSMVYDPSGDRAIVYGGTDFNTSYQDVWALSLATPSWSQIYPLGSGPGTRTRHVAAWDADRGRMIVFGGYVFDPVNDTWALVFSPQPLWQAIAAAGPLPPASFYPVGVVDAARAQLIVFGSNSPMSAWSLNLTGQPAWNAVPAIGVPPDARIWASTVFDAPRRRAVIFGGRDLGYNYRRDVSALGFETVRTPVVRIAGQTYGQVGEPLTFDAHRCFDLEGEPLSFLWTFGDGSGAAGPAVSHAYGAAGTYMVRLTGTDGAGTSADSTAITIDTATPVLQTFEASAEEGRVWLEWSVMAEASFERYQIERAETDAGPWIALASEIESHGNRMRTADDGAREGRPYVYRLLGVDASGGRTILGQLRFDVPDRPVEFSVGPIVPCPSRGPVSIEYSVPRTARVSLRIFDVHGRELATIEHATRGRGRYRATWEGRIRGRRVESGVYFVRCESPGLPSRVRRLVIMP